MKEEYNPRLRAVLLEAVEKQISTNDPPETRMAYERLLGEGRSEYDAKVLIANVVAAEVFEIVKQKKPYDHERFIQALARLPELPAD